MKTLVILGNGFDLNNQLKTSYSDFAESVQDDVISEKYSYIFPLDLNEDTLWSNLEEALGDVDVDNVIEYLSQSGSYNDCGADDWSDADHHWHSQIFEDVNNITEHFKTYLVENVIPEIHNINPKVKISVPVSVINFNYTPTIEKYGISSRNIHYIHRKYDEDRIVLGHNSENEINRIEKHNQYESEGDVDIETRVSETYDEVLSFLKSHKKNHEANFTELKLDWSECDKVICLGHSCSPVDMPYFKMIHSKVGEVPWIFSYYDENNIVPTDLKHVVNELGVKHYEFIPSIDDIIVKHLSI